MPSYTPRLNTFPPVGAHLIAGDWVTEGAAGTGVSLNPARPDEPVGDYPIGDAGTASDAVGAAVEAQTSWRSLPFGARARILEQAARLFDERADDLALLCHPRGGQDARRVVWRGHAGRRDVPLPGGHRQDVE